MEQTYLTGDPVHLGDRVQYHGTYATVVGVSDGDGGGEFAAGYDDYSGSDAAVIICDDDGEVTPLRQPDELERV